VGLTDAARWRNSGQADSGIKLNLKTLGARFGLGGMGRQELGCAETYKRLGETAQRSLEVTLMQDKGRRRGMFPTKEGTDHGVRRGSKSGRL